MSAPIDDDWITVEEDDGRVERPRGVNHDQARAAHAEPWRMLVVDDDIAVHDGTRYALADYRLDGRGLAVFSAASASEAQAMLRTGPDYAVILLDVVMETETAGLSLVQWVRETLGNTTVRIILRTGQPGQAPPRQVVVDYDINDYKAKTELSEERLFTSITTALRSYDQLIALDAHRRALEMIVETADLLLSDPTFARLNALVLERLSRLLGVPADGLVALIPKGGSSEATETLAAAKVVAGMGRYAASLSKPLGEVVDHGILTTMAPRLGDTPFFGGDMNLMRLPVPEGGAVVVLLHGPAPLGAHMRMAVSAFCGKLGIAYRNVRLVDEMRRMNEELEHRVAKRTEALEKANVELERLATMDSLTGLRNRRSFLEHANDAAARARRYRHSTAVLVLDLDNFKSINDTHGHAAGDHVLRRVTETLRQELRDVDIAGRLGGEEFAVILPETDVQGAMLVAERLRVAIEHAAIDLVPHDTDQPGGLRVTTSIGMTVIGAADSTVEAALARADDALYTAKRRGRNRVEAART